MEESVLIIRIEERLSDINAISNHKWDIVGNDVYKDELAVFRGTLDSIDDFLEGVFWGLD